MKREIACHSANINERDVVWEFDIDKGVHHITMNELQITTDNQLRAGQTFGEFVRKSAKQSGNFDGGPVTGDAL